jgi:hypothetical protein
LETPGVVAAGPVFKLLFKAEVPALILLFNDEVLEVPVVFFRLELRPLIDSLLTALPVELTFDVLPLTGYLALGSIVNPADIFCFI